MAENFQILLRYSCLNSKFLKNVYNIPYSFNTSLELIPTLSALTLHHVPGIQINGKLPGLYGRECFAYLEKVLFSNSSMYVRAPGLKLAQVKFCVCQPNYFIV